MCHHPVCTQYDWCRSRQGISLRQSIGVRHKVQASDRYPATLLAAFSAVWLGLAINPSYRQDWLLENVIVFVGVPALVIAYHRLRFSNFAYTCLFVFLVLHEIGAHYTYSEVPWRDWLQALGDAKGDGAPTGRNHYDRLVHFSYGLLVLPAAWELINARMSPRGTWRYLMPVFFVMSHSVIYEVIEWLAAEVFGGNLGAAYLGTQGDQWDAQKDMALAAAGALLGTMLMALRTAWPRRK
jgi:putative membrane protein